MLRVLTRELDEKDFLNFIDEAKTYTDEDDKENADSVTPNENTALDHRLISEGTILRRAFVDCVLPGQHRKDCHMNRKCFFSTSGGCLLYGNVWMNDAN